MTTIYTIVAPLSGTVESIDVLLGSPISAGESVMVLESMKVHVQVKSDVNGLLSKFLVKEGVTINAYTNGQGTAILKAAQHGNYRIVEYLLENGADPYLGNGGQQSVMEYARRENNRRLLNLLKDYNKEH